MLHVDIPTSPELRALMEARSPACVSIYVETTPLTQDVGAARIAYRNMARAALEQAADAGLDKGRLANLSLLLDDIAEDEDYWRFQAHSLAVFVTPDEQISTFRLPNRLSAGVHVSDRFHVKPLLRATTFPNHAFVLALAEKGPRLVEVFADLPAIELRVPGLPESAGDATRRASVNDRSAAGRIQGGEGQKVLLRQYARKIDAALRPILSGREEPLIVAATDPLAPIFFEVCTYPGLVREAIATSPVAMTPAQLADRARGLMDGVYAGKVASVRETFAARETVGRATTDIAQAARAATIGAVDTLLVDIDKVVPGTLDEDGRVSFADGASASTYGVVDEIAGRAFLTGARVMGVRSEDVPGGGPLAAILRYAV